LLTLLVIGAIAPANGQSESISQVIKAKKMDANLAAQFPIEKSFQGISATFSDPKILIDSLDQSVKLQLTSSSQHNKQILQATLIFTGNMQYHRFSEAYVFENMLLDGFKINQNTYLNPDATIKTIKQSLINDFADLLLFEQVATNRPADEIEISTNQLRFIWR
jgi:hypothetical protein